MPNLISIIVPVYNKELYIERCINSILNQTYNNFELILVNDGSTDNSLKIINSIRDERIKVISKKNGGVSSARNVGINNANGEFICFIDADDFVDKDYLKKFNLTSDDDLIIGGYKEVFDEHSNVKCTYLPFQNTDVFAEKFDQLFLRENFQYIMVPYCKLFKKSIIIDNSIFFDENYSYGEDIIFNLKFLKYIKKIRFVSFCGYFNCNVPNSLSRRYIKDLYKIDYYIYQKINDFINNKIISDNIFIKYSIDSLINETHSNYKKFKFVCGHVTNYMYENMINFHNLNSLKYKAFYFLIKFKIYFILYYVLKGMEII